MCRGSVAVAGLTEALTKLASAETDVAASLAAAAETVNAGEDTPLEGDDLDNFVDAYTGTDAEAELTTAETAVGTAEAKVLTAESTLVTERNKIGDGSTASNGDYLDGERLTDANLTAALNEVKADIAATAGESTDVSALLNARTQAQANLDTDIGKDGTNTEVLQDLRSAIVAYAEAGGNLSADVKGGSTDPVSGLLASINTALENDETNGNTNAADGLVGNFYNTNTDAAEYTFGTATAEEKAVSDAITVITERDELVEAVTTAEDNLTGSSAPALGQDLGAIETLIEAREEDKADITEAQSELSEAQAYFSELTDLVDSYETAGKDVTDAQQALEDLGVENLVELDTTSNAGAAGEADLYLFNSEDTGDISLLNFEADDQLFVGEGFTRTDLAADADLASENLGDAGAMEVFFQQDGTNTVVSIEGEAFGGSATNTDDLTQITLTGVNAEDVSFQDGYIAIA